MKGFSIFFWILIIGALFFATGIAIYAAFRTNVGVGITISVLFSAFFALAAYYIISKYRQFNYAKNNDCSAAAKEDENKILEEDENKL